MVKKGLMVQMWRIQQSQAMIGIFFWALTLAGVYYLSYFHPYFRDLGLVTDKQVFLGTIMLALLILLAFLLMGLIYDRALRLWREQTDVIVERNPYSKERLMPKEVIFWRRSQLSIMKELAKKDTSIQKDIDFMEKWIEKSVARYKELREGAEDLEKWVMT